MQFNEIGVVGAGTMGREVAYVAASNAIPVVLVDNSSKVIAVAKETLTKELRLYSFFGGKQFQQPMDAILANIQCTTSYDMLADVDYVVENVPEDLAVKQEVYSKLDKICKKETIFAANTSTISIAELAAFTTRPEKVVGLHFMNPVALKSVVEVIYSKTTSVESKQATREFLASLEKTGVEINDSPGFVINRILMPAINEAAQLVTDQVTTAENIDKLFSGCLGHQMGPLATADLIGLDTIVYSLESLYRYYKDAKYIPCEMLQRKVAAGELGKKSGKGFYTYLK